MGSLRLQFRGCDHGRETAAPRVGCEVGDAMSDYRQVLRWIGKRLTPSQHRACAYLERQGFTFCGEFGYDNAIEKAREHWRARKQKRKR
jgi:hypothetical protein